MLNKFKSLFRSPNADDLVRGEQDSSYYNQAFSTNEDWEGNYWSSPYYSLWTVIIDRLRRQRSKAILEIACGPGQLASAICDSDFQGNYVGFDFSDVAIEYAKKACPRYQFSHENALETTLFDKADYDTVVTTEFLEHIEEDLSVLTKIRSGTCVIGTVPNFPYISHVRHFSDTGQVADRYEHLFDKFNVVEIHGSRLEQKFFLLEGVRK